MTRRWRSKNSPLCGLLAGQLLVEVTTPDLGRDPLALRRVAEATELHMVMGTGWYRQPFYPPEIDALSTE